MSNARFGLRTRLGSVRGIIEGNSASNLLLDVYPTAVTAFSLRKLRDAYSGNSIKVRRSSDNTEQNIGFVGTSLDTVSLLSFVGAGSGFVSTFYDQSGNSNNAVQTTLVSQPRIVNSGVLETEGGQPCMFFDGLNDCFIVTNFTVNTYISLYAVSKNTVAKPFFVEHSANANSTSGFWIYGATNSTWLFNRSGLANNAIGIAGWAGATRVILTLSYNTIRQNYYKNGVQQINNGVGNTLRADSALTTTLNICSRNQTGVFSEGQLQELVIYNDTTSANQSGIETNINNYYSIF